MHKQIDTVHQDNLSSNSNLKDGNLDSTSDLADNSHILSLLNHNHLYIARISHNFIGTKNTMNRNKWRRYLQRTQRNAYTWCNCHNHLSNRNNWNLCMERMYSYQTHTCHSIWCSLYNHSHKSSILDQCMAYIVQLHQVPR